MLVSNNKNRNYRVSGAAARTGIYNKKQQKVIRKKKDSGCYKITLGRNLI